MSALVRRTAVSLAVAAAMAGMIGYYALVTHLAFAAQARRVLAVHFSTVPAKPGEAVAIWLHNSRLVVGVAICIVVSGLVKATRGSARPSFVLSDALLTIWAVSVVVTTGVLLGAYGNAQAKVFWPYAPVELVGWALLLAVYTNARLRHYGWRQIAQGLVSVEAILAVAAILEASGGKWL
jgi:hypothetical protein